MRDAGDGNVGASASGYKMCVQVKCMCIIMVTTTTLKSVLCKGSPDDTKRAVVGFVGGFMGGNIYPTLRWCR